MMRLCVLTAFWQRPEVSELYWQGMHRAKDLLAKFHVDLFVSWVSSPGDEANARVGEEWCRRSFPGVGLWDGGVPNQPIAAKFNEMSLAAKSFDPDYCILVDSDDLLADGYWYGVVDRMRAGVEYAGVLDFYCYDLHSGRAGQWMGYPAGNKRHGESIGAGRLWSRRVLEALDWELWPRSDRPSGLDGLSHTRVVGAGFTAAVEPCSAWGGPIVDLKSGTNMWSYDRLPLVPADPGWLRGQCPEIPSRVPWP